MKTSIYLSIVTVLTILNCANGQTSLPNNPSNLPDNFNLLISPESSDGWIVLKDTLYVQPDSVFSKYKSWWGFNSNDEIINFENLTDDQNIDHVGYYRIHKGFKIEPCVTRIHASLYAGAVINGNLGRALDVDIQKRITFSRAIEISKLASNDTLFKWEDSASEAFLKLLKGPMATYFPSEELIIWHFSGKSYEPNNFRLAYKIELYTLLPNEETYTYYIDAIDGSVLYIDDHTNSLKKPVYLPHYGVTDSINVSIDSLINKKVPSNYKSYWNIKNNNTFYHLFDSSS